MGPRPVHDFAVPAGCAPASVGEDPRGFVAARFAAAELATVAERLAVRGAAALDGVPLPRRLAVWNDALEALLDPESEERGRWIRPLLATSRLSAEGLTEGLRVMLEGARGEGAEELLRRVAGRRIGSLAAAVLAGNVPALAVQAVLPAMALGRPLLVKSASDEPLFAAALVDALVRREPALGEALAALRFDGRDAALADAALGRAERVVAYGGAEAIGALAERLGPRLVAHGPKASLAFVSGAIDPVAVGRALARDVALFDQRGCLSVHAVYVEGDARELAEALAWGLALEHRRLPPGPIAPAAAAAVHQLRGAAELAGSAVGRLDLGQGTVLLEREVAFHPSPGLRTVRVHGVDDLARAVEGLAAWRGRLQGVAVTGEAAERAAERLVALGVSRIAPAGGLQEADAAWANGGVDPLDAFG
ncbi:MAG: hypothetical protein H6511_09200 [Holophagales bacterium]|nr:hypothetical protein [Holophagales bacterium]